MERAKEDTVRTAALFRALRAAELSTPPPNATAQHPRVKRGPGPLGRALFHGALASLYYALSPFAGRGAKPGWPADRPLQVARLVARLTQGGVGKVALQTALRLPAARVETTFIVFDEKRPDPAPLRGRPGVRVIARKLALSPIAGKFQYFRGVRQLAKIIRDLNPDLIHVHEPQFALAARLAVALAGGHPAGVQRPAVARPQVVHLHNDYTARHEAMPRVAGAMIRNAVRRACLIACSRTIHEAGARWLGVPPGSIALIEDGTDDLANDAPDAPLAASLARAAGDRRIVAMMAHLMPHKRIEDFLAGCRALLDAGAPIFCLLMAYGKPEKETELRGLFINLFAPAEGEFLYQVRAPQHLLGQVAVGVTTSSLEGLGLNVLEFQIAGVPVVASDLFPHREMIVDEETGLLFPVGDVAALIRQMKRVLDDDALARRLAAAGRASAQARRWQNTADATLQLYERVMTNL